MKTDAERNPWTTVKEEVVYDTPWIRVWNHDVITPAGKPGIYGIVHFKGVAIGVIPLDDEGNTWIVGQYRYPMQTYTWEIPEGGGSREIPPVESGKRELMEECGISASKWTLIQEMQMSNSATDEYAYLFVAQGLEFHQSSPDETEELQIRKVPFETLYEMVKSGECTDSLTVAAVLKLKLMILEGTIKI